jgi:acyl dehydratase
VSDALRDGLLARVGKPLDSRGVVVAPDPVNAPMIRHWVDALDDRNPAYDERTADEFGGLVAPPAMLQSWTMPRPTIDGIRERGGAPGVIDPDSPLPMLAAAGFPGTLATNTVLRFDRYLRVGDVLSTQAVLASVSELKHTGLGRGYFVTWSQWFRDQDGEQVGSQDFTVFKFAPVPSPEHTGDRPPRPAAEEPAGEELPPFDLEVTATVIVAGAVASRDFMPVHHDRDYAQGQGAPDVFMNILTSNGYVSRYVTDWAGGHARIGSISTRLGAPAVPGKPLRFRGRVLSATEVLVRADNDLGNHLTSTVSLIP